MNKFFKAILFRPILAWGILVTPIILLGFLSILFSRQLFEEKLIDTIEIQADSATQRMKDYIRTIQEQTLRLSELPEVENYFIYINQEDSSTIDKERTSELLLQIRQEMRSTFLNNQYLDHVRFIDHKGKEILRLDQDNSGAPLKNVGHRNYFQKTIVLDRGEYYISPINLNREGNAADIEIPHKPVLRFAMPIFDRDGQRQGIVVENVLANKIFDAVQSERIHEQYGINLLVLDSKGYYLDHPNPDMEFGFEFGKENLNLSAIDKSSTTIVLGKRSIKLPVANLRLWRSIQDQKDGLIQGYTISGKSYLIFYNTVSFNETNPENDLKLIYLVPEAFAFAPIQKFSLIVVLLTLFSIAVVSYFLRKLSEANLSVNRLQKKEAIIKTKMEEALKRSQLKDQFLATMSHEFRTPLSIILGMTENLQEEILGSITPRQAKALQSIERGGFHLLSLINDILDLAKIEAGQFQLHCEPRAIAPIVHSSLDFIQTKANQKQITLVNQIPEALPKVNVDEQRIHQILLNLLDNAIKFTPEQGKVSVTVRLLAPHTVEEAPSLEVAVHDTGVGIDMADLKKLFQPFIQVGTSLKRRHQGTGLGLVLVKRFVELHGGQISVYSLPNQGSTFSFTLPDTE